jgi:hypothetical protein
VESAPSQVADDEEHDEDDDDDLDDAHENQPPIERGIGASTPDPPDLRTAAQVVDVRGERREGQRVGRRLARSGATPGTVRSRRGASTRSFLASCTTSPVPPAMLRELDVPVDDLPIVIVPGRPLLRTST